jgi:type II secretory pathway component PulF
LSGLYRVSLYWRGELIEDEFYASSKDLLYNSIFDKYPKAKIEKIREKSNRVSQTLNSVSDYLVKALNLNSIEIEDRISFFEQLAVMLDAGIPVLKSINEIKRSVKDDFLLVIIDSVIKEINNGSSLSKAFEQYETTFGTLSISMIRLGDKTGDMAKALFRLVKMLEEIRDNQEKFRKAISYPRNVVIAIVFAFVVMINYVIPKFKVIFDRFDSDLPIITQFLIGTEKLFSEYGLLLLLTTLTALFTILFYKKRSEKFAYFLDSITLKIYLIKDIVLYSTLSRFTSVFSELLNSGVSIYDSLQISISMVDNRIIREQLLISYEQINRGKSLHESFEETQLFENMVIQMVATGEGSGELQEMLNNISNYYKRKFDGIISNLESAIEPIILLFVGILVTLLALGIFMPVWDLGKVVIRGE